jgi:prephenate dehydratase
MFLWLLLLIFVDVFKALCLKVPIGVVPQENSIFGGVIETYDLLKVPDAAFIRGEITLKVEHCLLARKGVQHNDIRSVMSHEQVCLLRTYESHTA